MNSAVGSMKRRISHGQAIRSTAAFFRVTQRIGSGLLSPSSQRDCPLRRRALGGGQVVALDGADKTSFQDGQLALVRQAFGRFPTSQRLRTVPELFVFRFPLFPHSSPDLL